MWHTCVPYRAPISSLPWTSLGGSRWRLKYLGLCHPCGRQREFLTFGFGLAQTGYCRNLGNEPAGSEHEQISIEKRFPAIILFLKLSTQIVEAGIPLAIRVGGEELRLFTVADFPTQRQKAILSRVNSNIYALCWNLGSFLFSLADFLLMLSLDSSHFFQCCFWMFSFFRSVF